MSIENSGIYYKTHIEGLVQGIGFRPYTARLAAEHGLTGGILNGGGQVFIYAWATPSRYERFLKSLAEKPPENGVILNMSSVSLNREEYEKAFHGHPPPRGQFHILKSRPSFGAAFPPPDLPVCPQCLKEMSDPNDRRFGHLLISCTQCGPRYSIINKMPYDRENTSMEVFALCPQCAAEYSHPEGRRYHAQTVSCLHCGPKLTYRNREGDWDEYEGVLKAVQALSEGGILAVKGIGGYHFMCSPFEKETVLRLRSLKVREEKPFAVVFPSLESIRVYCLVSDKEESLLKSNGRPIVLLEQRENPLEKHPPLCGSVTQKSRYMGAMLPYTPLLHRLTELLGPLVATSANLSGEPILYRDEDVFALWNSDRGRGFLAGVLTHNREIGVSQDDSVAWVAAGEARLLRRARGYAPLPVRIRPTENSSLSVFGAGGHLKSAFCMLKGPFAYISQYLGDLDGVKALDIYKESVAHMEALLDASGRVSVGDLHPDYANTDFVEQREGKKYRIQHHHAHIASVMAENGLTGPVLGVALDGTGYGTDGTVWGGEFLLAEGGTFKRLAHLKAVPQLRGDEAMKDCLKTALCTLHGYGIPWEPFVRDLQPLKETGEPPCSPQALSILKKALDLKVGTLPSSSMGRLFDMAAALLHLCCYNKYEAQGAILLENAAFKALSGKEVPYPMAFDKIEKGNLDEPLILSARPVLEALIRGKASGASVESLALGFHKALWEGIGEILLLLREKTGVGDVALSGGVFQNRLLLESCKEDLEGRGFSVYLNREVPANDSGLCLGQAYLGFKLEEEARRAYVCGSTGENYKHQ